MFIGQILVAFVLGANAGIGLLYLINPKCRKEIKKYLIDLHE
jgi:hypothetical protein